MGLDQEITSAIKETKATIEKPTCPTKDGWNDGVCQLFSSKYQFPIECLEASTQKAIITRYTNFYAAGEVPEGLSSFDIIAAMIAIYPKEDCTKAADTIWPSSYFAKNGTLCNISPEYSVGEESEQRKRAPTEILQVVDEPGPLTKLDGEPGITLSELPGANTAEKAAETTNPLIYNYTQAISKSFLETIRKTLRSTEATAAQGRGIITIRRVLGYTALTMVRFLVKEPLQMASAFSKAQYRKNLIALLALTEVIYSPPCNKALQAASDAFNKQLSKPVFLFSMIVQRWKDLSQSQDKKMAAMLGASCLTHTSYNGMALIHLLIEVLHHFNVDWADLCLISYMDITKESWKRIAVFMKAYQHKDGPQFTQPWARVIDDGYLKELSGQNNFSLCTILAASIDDSVDGVGGVWDAQWAKTRQAEIGELKKLGYALRGLYTTRLTDVKALTTEASHLLAQAQKLDSGVVRAPVAAQATTLNLSDV